MLMHFEQGHVGDFEPGASFNSVAEKAAEVPRGEQDSPPTLKRDKHTIEVEDIEEDLPPQIHRKQLNEASAGCSPGGERRGLAVLSSSRVGSRDCHAGRTGKLQQDGDGGYPFRITNSNQRQRAAILASQEKVVTLGIDSNQGKLKDTVETTINKSPHSPMTPAVSYPAGSSSSRKPRKHDAAEAVSPIRVVTDLAGTSPPIWTEKIEVSPKRLSSLKRREKDGQKYHYALMQVQRAKE